ncbi:MAG: heme-binding protein [Spirochaetales bacterium]|nr:heme-binding protein [Spirochaetales bacterium]
MKVNGAIRGAFSFKALLVLLNLSVFFQGEVMAADVERPMYTVLEKNETIELRLYEDVVIAEVRVEGSRRWAPNNAFMKLFRFISGKNSNEEKIPMTAPVAQQSVTGETGSWKISFFMPSHRSLQDLPIPADEHVQLVRIPRRKMAAIQWIGSMNEKNFSCRKRHYLSFWSRKG